MSAIVARVIAIGQEVAGDDGVGPAVLRAVRASGVPPGVELHLAAEAMALMPLIETDALIIVVDAVIGPEPGRVLELGMEDVARLGLTPLSTHGVGVMQALELARLLFPATVSACIRIIGVGIPPPSPTPASTLSPPVAAAVPDAARVILRMLKEDPSHA